MKTRYVLGFAFDKSNNVILVQKTKPKWQAGLLNGVGGKIEPEDNTPIAAMVREFQEETNLTTTESQWHYVLTMGTDEWEVLVYTMTDLNSYYGIYQGQQTDTDETLVILPRKSLLDNDSCISNVPWLVAACVDAEMPVKYNLTFKDK